MRNIRQAAIPAIVTAAMLLGSGTAIAQDSGSGASGTGTGTTSESTSSSLDLSGLLDSVTGLLSSLLGGLGL